MSVLRNFFAGLRTLFAKKQSDRELDEELRNYLESSVAKKIESGMDRTQALREARMEMGSLESVKETVRAAGWESVLVALWQDIRYALRMLRKSPGFTAVAVLTLALGIGANTAIFSVVNKTLLAPLPFKDSSQLVNLHAHARFFDFWNLGLSLPDINDIRSQSKSFSAVVPFQYATVDLIGRDAPQQLDAARIPADFFSVLGLHPLYGRTFLPSEMQPGQDREAILSGALWRAQFGSDPRIVGTSITLDGKPCTIVGVMLEMPKMFSPAAMDIWTPFVPSQTEFKQRGSHVIPALARLKPGVTLRQAQAELDGIAARLAKAYPNDDKDWSFRADSLRADMNRDTRTPLLVLLGAVGFVLLIACANVGNLFLSRGWARRQELAIRATLGATRGRLIRQLLVESMILAFAGGACGLVLAYWGVDALKALVSQAIMGADRVGIDARVLLFTLGASILAGLLFGLAPAFLSSRHDLNTAMKESGAGAQTGASSSRHNPLRQILVVTEIALALVLVIGATLALRSFARLLNVNLGYRTDHILTVRLDFPSYRFKNTQESANFERQVLAQIHALPGVGNVAATFFAPLGGGRGEFSFEVEGDPSRQKYRADFSGVSSGYFDVLGIPFVAGRNFTDEDQTGSVPVYIVNQVLARRVFGNESPIGKRLSQGKDAKKNTIWAEIIGEVSDTRDRNPDAAPEPELYMPSAKGFWGGISLVIRTKTDPQSLAQAVKQRVWSLEKDQPVTDVKTMEQLVADSDAVPRFQTLLLGVFGALGLFLAVVGIYGVISYSVTQRTHEIGIRMALGAEPKQVLSLMLAQGLKLALFGVAIGIVASLALTRLMSSLLFDISATDPLTFAGVAILLAAVSLAASYIPARRAMRVDPMVALRYE